MKEITLDYSEIITMIKAIEIKKKLLYPSARERENFRAMFDLDEEENIFEHEQFDGFRAEHQSLTKMCNFLENALDRGELFKVSITLQIKN